MKTLVAVTLLSLLAACGSGTEPKAIHCAQAKRDAYAASVGGAMPAAWLESDVWRLSPITTLYFNADCSVTRVN